MRKQLEVLDVRMDFKHYYEVNKISEQSKKKFDTADIVVVPFKHSENEYYFAQESINFIKFCRLHDKEHSIDVLADKDIQIRSLHSFDIWMPVIWVASTILLPVAVNLVSSYIYDRLKGREKEEAEVDVTFVVNRESENKTIHFRGNAQTFKETFEKIDLNNM